jgi:hypothetical protein
VLFRQLQDSLHGGILPATHCGQNVLRMQSTRQKLTWQLAHLDSDTLYLALRMLHKTRFHHTAAYASGTLHTPGSTSAYDPSTIGRGLSLPYVSA